MSEFQPNGPAEDEADESQEQGALDDEDSIDDPAPDQPDPESGPASGA